MTARIGTPLAVLGLAVLVVLAGSPSIAAGGSNKLVKGEPDLSTSMATTHLEPGERTTVTVAVTNNGEVVDSGLPQFESEVQTARGVTLDIADEADLPLEVKSGPVALGLIKDGQIRTATFTVELAEDAPPGSYDLPLTASYEYTRFVGYDVIDREPGYRDVDSVTRDETVDTDVGFTIESSSRFEIDRPVTSSLTAGDTGTVSFELENVGTQTAHDAQVTLQSNHSVLQFGQQSNPQPASSVYAGTLAPGESTTVSVQTVAAADSTPGSYPVTVAVDYEDPNGLPGRDRPTSVGIDVRTEQAFHARNTSSTLTVGDDGMMRTTLVNSGPNDVNNAIVRYHSQSQTLSPTETEYAVGNLSAGETTEFAFEFDVSEEASSGPRMPTFVVQYRNNEGDQRTSKPFDVPVEVGPEEDRFRIDSVATTVDAGEQTTVELEVTNTGTEPVSDVEAKLFADDPLSTNNDEAFAGQLDPGESTTVAFDIQAASGIISKSYPVSIDFTYEDADGDTEVTDTYRVPITVTESDESRSWLPLLIGGGLVLFGIGVWQRDKLASIR